MNDRAGLFKMDGSLIGTIKWRCALFEWCKKQLHHFMRLHIMSSPNYSTVQNIGGFYLPFFLAWIRAQFKSERIDRKKTPSAKQWLKKFCVESRCCSLIFSHLHFSGFFFVRSHNSLFSIKRALCISMEHINGILPEE